MRVDSNGPLWSPTFDHFEMVIKWREKKTNHLIAFGILYGLNCLLFVRMWPRYKKPILSIPLTLPKVCLPYGFLGQPVIIFFPWGNPQKQFIFPSFIPRDILLSNGLSLECSPWTTNLCPPPSGYNFQYDGHKIIHCVWFEIVCQLRNAVWSSRIVGCPGDGLGNWGTISCCFDSIPCYLSILGRLMFALQNNQATLLFFYWGRGGGGKNFVNDLIVVHECWLKRPSQIIKFLSIFELS